MLILTAVLSLTCYLLFFVVVATNEIYKAFILKAAGSTTPTAERFVLTLSCAAFVENHVIPGESVKMGGRFTSQTVVKGDL